MSSSVSVPRAAVTLEKSYLFGINLVHALIVGPFLMYVGYKGKDAGDGAFYALLYVGCLVHFYHVYRLFVPRKVVELYRDKQEPEPFELPRSEWPQISSGEVDVQALATNVPGQALSS